MLRLPIPFLLTTILSAQTSWTSLEQNGVGEALAAMAYDSTQSAFFSFGTETRRFDGTAWVEVPTANRPPAGRGRGMVFDSIRGRLVLFSDESSSDTWEFDGTDWTRVATVGPSPRRGYAMAFDPLRGVTILFGGCSGVTLFSDTWSWDGTSWTRALGAGTPGPRCSAQMTFDGASGTTLLFGGYTSLGGPFGPDVENDVWSFDGSSWTPFPPGGPFPGTATGGVVSDPTTGALHVFGGIGSTFTPFASHWIRLGGVWSQSQSLPVPLAEISAAWDPSSNSILAIGCGQVTGCVIGDPAFTLRWDGSGWTNVTGQPYPRRNHAMTTDSVRDAVVMYGGFQTPSVQEWSGSNWTERPVAGAHPGLREEHSLTYHHATDRSVLFGGRKRTTGIQTVAETLLWDGQQWTDPALAVEPSPRFDHSAAEDRARGRIVLFGGYLNGPASDETWEFDGSSWSQVMPSQSPTARGRAAMAFDPIRGVTVLFGGTDAPFSGGTWSRDTWQFDGLDWTTVSTVDVPPALEEPQLVWDAFRERLVLRGEVSLPTGSPLQTQTWELLPSGWTLRVAGFGPAPNALAFDPNTGRVLTFGNGNSSGNQGSVTFSYGADFPAGADAFGTGCPGSHGVAQTAETLALPWIGETLEVGLGALAPGAVGSVAIGFSDSTWSGIPLPVDLGVVGAPCTVLSAWDVLQLATPAGTWQAPVPTVGALMGRRVFVQGLAVDLPANPLGLVTSNALALTIGHK